LRPSCSIQLICSTTCGKGSLKRRTSSAF
jgi:hypothetical protein